MKNGKETISTCLDFLIFWAGVAGKQVNFKKVADVYGKETAERLQREINVVKNAGTPHV